MIHLYLWVLVAWSHTSLDKHEWQYFGGFDTPSACHAAAKELGREHYRCISKNDGRSKQ